MRRDFTIGGAIWAMHRSLSVSESRSTYIRPLESKVILALSQDGGMIERLRLTVLSEVHMGRC